MRFKILGTAAAEGWPGIFCDCAVCRKARELGGKNLRLRAAYLVGRRVLIDFGPDIYVQSVRFGICLANITDLLITHSHQDHFCAHELNMRRKGFWAGVPPAPLRIYGNAAVGRKLRQGAEELELLSVQFVELEPFRPVSLPDGLEATPIVASHAAEEEVALNFLLCANGRYLLQGNDTGWYPEETWEFLAGKRLSVVVMDCTCGKRQCGENHLGIPDVLSVKAKLAEIGCVDEGTRFVATHFSHNGLLLHDELVERLEPQGVEVAFDGMELTW